MLGLSPIGIALPIMLLLHIPCNGQSVINVTEGQNLTLECGNVIYPQGKRKWMVTSNGQTVSTCGNKGCFNSYPDKFLLGFTEKPGYRRTSPLVLKVFNVPRNLSRIECGYYQWEVNVTAKSPSIILTSDYGSEDISVGSHVSFMCKTRSDGLDPGSLILYKGDINNVLNSTSSSNSLTYFLSDLVCGSSFVVGCKEEHLSAVEMKVRVEKCITFLANNQKDVIVVDAWTDLTLYCSSIRLAVTTLRSFSNSDSVVLAQSTNVLPIHHILTIPCWRNNFRVSCNDGLEEEFINVTINPCYNEYDYAAPQDDDLTFQVNGNDQGFSEYFDGDISVVCQNNKNRSSWLSIYLKLENSKMLIDRRYNTHINISVTLYDLQRWEILSYDNKDFFFNLKFGCRRIDGVSNATKEIDAQFEYHSELFVRSSPIINSIGVKVGVSLACILTLVVIILIIIVLCRRARARSRKHQQDNPPAYSDIFFVNPTTELPDYASLPPPYNETIEQQH